MHYSLFIVVGFSILGILSFIFHLKSLKIYKLVNSEQRFPKIDSVFWWFNSIFGIICILSASYFIYVGLMYFDGKTPNELTVVIVPTMILGIWILLDAIFLNRIIKLHKYDTRHSDIDGIKGA